MASLLDHPNRAAPSAADGEGTPALDITGLSHSYGSRRALKDVSFTIEPGTFAVLLGLNGAGKTTLFSLVTRLFNAKTGRIRVLGNDLSREPRAALGKLGVVFQSRTLDLDLNIAQNFFYHAALHGIGAREARVRTAELLRPSGLQDRLRDRVRDLSGGQIRRVEILRALLHRPKLLLLDEPTVGLDVEARAALLKQVRALVETEGLSVLWATHLIDEVAPNDMIIVLHHGEVLAKGLAREIAAGQGSIEQAFVALTKGAHAGKEAGA